MRADKFLPLILLAAVPLMSCPGCPSQPSAPNSNAESVKENTVSVKQAVGLTEGLRRALGEKRLLLLMMPEGVIVLASRDPKILGKPYSMGDVFSSDADGSHHEMVLEPMNWHGNSIVIPDDERDSFELYEPPDPNTTKEYIRLAKLYREKSK
jgi:hypothetical protein